MRQILVLLLLWCSATLSQAQEPPNIIIFLADDLNQQDVGAYGNKQVKTPYMDQLAAEGMRFTKAYAASPMCTPSRSAMFTGLYPHRNGAQMNHFTVQAGIKSLPHYLQQAGYRVVISGKIHMAPLANFPFEHIGKEFGQYEPVANRLDSKKETVNAIEAHFRSAVAKPLCLVVAPWVPHVPWFPNRDFDPAALPLPEYLADTKETRQALAAYYQSIGEADKMLGEVMGAIDKAGKKNNTVFIFLSDQGAQFPGAKWTVYDQGLRVPLIVRWPGNTKPGSVSDALVSLVDMTPTLIDLAGGRQIDSLDGRSFARVLRGKTSRHHSLVFAETSMEPHFWYNYVPARSVITDDGFHLIKNYHPGLRFITHIDQVERNEFYFDSWVVKATTDPVAKFLLDRYSYRPPLELFDLNKDRVSFHNLANTPAHQGRLRVLQSLLAKELARQGESEASILAGTLPQFAHNSYSLSQYGSAMDLSFNRKLWNPDTLHITGFLKGIDQGGIVCDYFGQFKLYAYQGRMGIQLADGTVKESELLKDNTGHLWLTLAANGALTLRFNNTVVVQSSVGRDLTKVKGGFVTCGKLQGQEQTGRLRRFQGYITDLRFSMNTLLPSP
ncbi:sulfatase [Paraflavitalea pollutisoli]|uniref:sulfatase family protein n=1 Tax=Paraflavitalea pollutisoli TaxID=3034143 RepID=UPI0023EBF833|nr:sulfatase [Paraflavitalea sp. H1-2-19X]